MPKLGSRRRHASSFRNRRRRIEMLENRRMLFAGDMAIYTVDIAGEPIVRESSGQDFTHSFHEVVTDETDTYELLGGNVITADEGHHMIIYNSRFDAQNFSDTQRTELQTNLNVAGVDVPIGWGHGYIRRQQGQYETVTAGGGIVYVEEDNSQIRLQTFATDDDVSLAVRADDATGIQLLKLNDNWDYLRLSLQNTIPGVNDETFIPVSYDTVDELDSGSFDFDANISPTDITLKTPGHYMVFANTYAVQQTGRTNVLQRLTIDGTEVQGSRTTFHQRNNNSAFEGAAAIGMIIETTSPNQTLNVESALDNVQFGSLFFGGRSAITIAKIPDDGDYIRLYENGGQNLNTFFPTELDWDDPTVQKELDAPFTHSPTTNSTEIGVTQSDDYLFFTSAFDDNDGVTRGFYWQRWQVNDGTPYEYGQTGRYSRDSSDGSDQFGNWSGFMVDLQAGDYVEAITQGLGNVGVNTVDRQALQGVRLQSIFPQRPVLNDFDGDVTDYPLTAGPVPIDSGAAASISDRDTTDYQNGFITVTIADGQPDEDFLSIRDQGTGAGEIGFDGLVVEYEGNDFGIVNGGSNGDPLRVSFLDNGFATLPAISALLRNITFENNNPFALPDRTLDIYVDDGDEAYDNFVLNLNLVRPLAPGGSLPYAPGCDAHVPIAPDLVALGVPNDVDSATVNVGGFVPNDELLINGLTSDTLSFPGGDILVSIAGDTATLTQAAGDPTSADFQAALRAITYQHDGGSTVQTSRDVTFTISDNGYSASANVGITVFRVVPDGLIFLNEIMYNPQDGDHGREYIELRGPENSLLCADTYVLAIEGDDGDNPGQVEHVFALDGMRFGSEGFLVLAQAEQPYPIHPDSILERATGPSGWDVGWSSATTDLENNSTSYMVVRSLTNAPVGGVTDIDVDDDGVIDPSIQTDWVFGDTIAFLDGGPNDIAYGEVVFRNGSAGTTTAPSIQELAFTPQFLARDGNTIDKVVEDWVAATLDGQSPAYSLSETNVSIPRLAGEELDHLGTINFALPVNVTLSDGSNDVTEGLGMDYIDISLGFVPPSGVTLQINSDDQLDVSLNGSSFTSSITLPIATTVPQRIFVRATDDTDIENDHTGTLNIDIGSDDPRFNNLDIESQVFNITDNEAPRPDLVITNVRALRVDDNSIDFAVTFTNEGNAPAALDGVNAGSNADNVRFAAYTSPDELHNNNNADVFATSTIVGSSPVGDLAPGDSFTGVYSASTPIDLDQRPYLTVEIDSTDVIDEGADFAGEGNNTFAALIDPRPVFDYTTPSGIFTMAPNSTIPITITLDIPQPVSSFQLHFDNSSPELDLSNWTTNQFDWTVTLDGNLDSANGDSLVAAAAFGIPPRTSPIVLGTFEVTAPNQPGQYTLSLESTDLIAPTALVDPNGDNIDIPWHGDIVFNVIPDSVAPDGFLQLPIAGSTITQDRGYVDIRWVDNESGIATSSIGTDDVSVTGVDIDSVEDLGGGAYRYHYNLDGETLADGVIGVTLNANSVQDSVGNQFPGGFSSFTLDTQGPSILEFNINPTLIDPPDRAIGPQPTSWTDQRSDLREIQLVLSEDVGVTVDNLTFVNLGTTEGADEVEVTLDARHLDVTGNVVTLSFAEGELEDGIYRLTVSGLSDALGNPMGDVIYSGNTQNRLFQYTGDFNGDGSVTIFDFSAFAYWFGFLVGDNGSPSYIDMNKDGGASIFDFSLFRNQFGSSLNLPVPPTAGDDGSLGAPFLSLPLDGWNLSFDVLGNDVPVGLVFVTEVNPLVDNEMANNPNADVWVNPDGTVGYQAANIDGGYSGIDVFSYTISDGSGRTDEGYVYVEVSSVPRPILVADDASDRALLDVLGQDESDDSRQNDGNRGENILDDDLLLDIASQWL